MVAENHYRSDLRSFHRRRSDGNILRDIWAAITYCTRDVGLYLRHDSIGRSFYWLLDSYHRRFNSKLAAGINHVGVLHSLPAG